MLFSRSRRQTCRQRGVSEISFAQEHTHTLTLTQFVVNCEDFFGIQRKQEEITAIIIF